LHRDRSQGGSRGAFPAPRSVLGKLPRSLSPTAIGPGTLPRSLPPTAIGAGEAPAEPSPYRDRSWGGSRGAFPLPRSVLGRLPRSFHGPTPAAPPSPVTARASPSRGKELEEPDDSTPTRSEPRGPRRCVPHSGTARGPMRGGRDARACQVGEGAGIRSCLPAGKTSIASMAMGTASTGLDGTRGSGKSGAARGGLDGAGEHATGRARRDGVGGAAEEAVPRAGGCGLGGAPRRRLGGASDEVASRARRCRLGGARRCRLGGAADGPREPLIYGGFWEAADRSTGGLALGARRGSRMVVGRTVRRRVQNVVCWRH
jgi:hypothetical protein